MNNSLIVQPGGGLVESPSHLPLDQNPALVYLAQFKETSQRSYQTSLGKLAYILTGVKVKEKKDELPFLASINWADLRFQNTLFIRSKLQQMVDKGEISPKSANHYLTTLRGILKTCWRLRQMTTEEYQFAVDLEPVKGQSLLAGRDIKEGERLAMLKACPGDPLGARDAAIIAILYSCGLRRAELVKLDLADYDQKTGELKVLHAKGNKQRILYIEDSGVRATLEDWLTIRGQVAGPLFTQVIKGGRVRLNRLTTQAVYHLLQARSQQAGVDPLSPHDFRRTTAGDLIDAGVDLVTVQKILGHADVSTTARYDRRGEEAKRKAAGLLHVPYTRRTLKAA